MHPLTQARVDSHNDVKKAISEYSQARILHAQKKAHSEFVERKYGMMMQAIQRLVEAAQSEGAGD